MLSPYRFNANPPAGSTSGKPLLVTPDSGQGFPIEIGVSPIIGGTVGRILFEGTGNVVQQSANLFWDNNNNQLLLNNGSITNPSFAFANDPDTGMRLGAASDLRYTVAGEDRLRIDSGTVIIASTGQLAFGSSGIASPDIFIRRDNAANTLAQRNGTNAQAFRVYDTFTDSSNYERVALFFSSDIARLMTEQAGTGTAQVLMLGTTGTANIIFRTNNTSRWNINGSTGQLSASTDNANDIGQTGASRPRTIYIGTSIQIEANAGLVLTNQTSGPGAGAGTLTNAPSAGDPDFWLPVSINGTAHWIPAWAA